ncbi:MAG: DUF1080 domain-containing protein, partial [Acidobacteria bacterium]|nr:DUF1080 domain-containing protein [Acidobacteriota bacterium]
MRRFLLLALAPAALAAQPGFEKLFNGRNLDGWEAHTPEVWSARDGMIVGKSAGL